MTPSDALQWVMVGYLALMLVAFPLALAAGVVWLIRNDAARDAAGGEGGDGE
jgi:hypothetical protein